MKIISFCNQTEDLEFHMLKWTDYRKFCSLVCQIIESELPPVMYICIYVLLLVLMVYCFDVVVKCIVYVLMWDSEHCGMQSIRRNSNNKSETEKYNKSE